VGNFSASPSKNLWSGCPTAVITVASTGQILALGWEIGTPKALIELKVPTDRRERQCPANVMG